MAESRLPKQFIKEDIIGGFEAIVKVHPYFSFALIGIGIEFLGKCLHAKEKSWHNGSSQYYFERAIKELNALKKYETYLTEYEMWTSLRNGFSHSLIPKPPISLSSLPGETPHLKEYVRRGRKILNLKNPEFFDDFKAACHEVIAMDFPDPDDKMNKPYLSIWEVTQ
jgi:hypothetical protein